MGSLHRSVWIFLAAIVTIAWSQTEWTSYTGNPVITAAFDTVGKPESFSSLNVIKDGALYRMWYTKKGSTTVSETEGIGYATSSDGMAWTLVSGAALENSASASRFDSKKVGQCAVIKENDTLLMWYWGDGPNIGNIGYAWSLDGAVWNKVNGPNADSSVYSRAQDSIGSGGSYTLALVSPSVIKDGSTYKMWYGRYNMSGFQIGLAVSTDRLHWTRVLGSGPAGSVLAVGATGSFDAAGQLFPCVIKTGSSYEMWFTGIDAAMKSTIGYATSTDGVSWTKTTGSGTNGSIAAFGTIAVIKTGASYKAWSTSTSSATKKTLNYSTSGSTGVTHLNPAGTFQSMHVSNPLPRNGSISFSLEKAGRVSLQLYSMQGRLLATLVKGWRPAGDCIAHYNLGTGGESMAVVRLFVNGQSHTQPVFLKK